YFVYGKLMINFYEGKFKFVWEPKLFFKFKNIPDLKIQDIQKVVLDNEEIIRKIIAKDREIILGNGKPKTIVKSDSQEFIRFLLEACVNVKIVDSWDVWYENGYLKWALRVNTVIILFAVFVFVFSDCVNVQIVDSRDVQYKKGDFKCFLIIKTVLILFAVFAFEFLAITKGLKSITPNTLFMIIGLLSQLFIKQNQMKKKKK